MRHLGQLGILLCLVLTSTCGAPDDVAEHPEGGAYEVVKTEAEWRAELTAEQYHALREKGTERPFDKLEGVLRPPRDTRRIRSSGETSI